MSIIPGAVAGSISSGGTVAAMSEPTIHVVDEHTVAVSDADMTAYLPVEFASRVAYALGAGLDLRSITVQPITRSGA